ncbi:FAD-binding oxidoreductase [Rhodobacteraceae bacterium KMM 6894]|nr:FAD-binding oxidoreductase [Rhodobacteraceae bacterium KMM 6894]
MMSSRQDAVSASLAKLLGDRGWLTEPADMVPFCTDWAGRGQTTPLGVARPNNTLEVAAVVRLCHSEDIVIVPQGGRTGLVLGNIPLRDGVIVLSLSRMNAISSPVPGDFCVEVEAGVVLGDLHNALEGTGLMFPMHLGSEGSAQCGGLIATNAGGNMAFRYGMMQDQILGLEVVLPDGQIWNGVRLLIKDNAGFHLRRLFCGSEGRLGIITRAVLRLQSAPRSRSTAFLAFHNIQAALDFSTELRLKFGELVTGVEFATRTVMDMALKHIPELTFPLEAPADAYLLVELSSTLAGQNLAGHLEGAFLEGQEAGLLVDGTIAQNEAQRAALWRLREELPEGQKRDGPQIKHDISIPVSRIAEFLDVANARARDLCPDLRICAFGHMGDGNIHYNYSPPQVDEEMPQAHALSNMVYDLVADFGGSFAAEHGLGSKKPMLADRERSIVERDLMRALRRALNPKDLLNPGVVID